MTKLTRYIFFIIGILLVNFPLSAQVVLNLKTGYIGIHPGNNPNVGLYENKLTPTGTFVAEPSVWLGLEYFIREDHTSFEIYQGIFSDAAARSAGFTFLGFKRRFFQSSRNSFYVEFGTTFSFRENWKTLSGYVPQNNYEGDEQWQTKWIYFSGGINYYYYLGKKSDISISVFYGHYDNTITFMLGYRFWFSTIFKHPKPCNCPFDKYNKKYKRNH